MEIVITKNKKEKIKYENPSLKTVLSERAKQSSFFLLLLPLLPPFVPFFDDGHFRSLAS